MTSSSSSLRAVLASALPYSDEYAVDLSQTLRPARDCLPNESIAVCWAAFWCVYVVCQM